MTNEREHGLAATTPQWQGSRDAGRQRVLQYASHSVPECLPIRWVVLLKPIRPQKAPGFQEDIVSIHVDPVIR